MARPWCGNRAPSPTCTLKLISKHSFGCYKCPFSSRAAVPSQTLWSHLLLKRDLCPLHRPSRPFSRSCHSGGDLPADFFPRDFSLSMLKMLPLPCCLCVNIANYHLSPRRTVGTRRAFSRQICEPSLYSSCPFSPRSQVPRRTVVFQFLLIFGLNSCFHGV